MQGFGVVSGSVANRTYRAWGARLLFFLKLTPMVRLGNRTYRAWMNNAVNAI